MNGADISARHSPDAVEDEEELNKDTTKGQDPTHEGGGDRMRQPVLVWDLTWNLICVYWLFNGLERGEQWLGLHSLTMDNLPYWFPKAKKGSKECERQRDPQPETEQGQEGGEGHGRTGPCPPQEQVQGKENRERSPARE